MSGWTTPDAVRERAERRWRDGSVLAAHVTGGLCPVLDMKVRGPGTREIGADLARVREWRDALVRHSRGGAAYTLTERTVGGRVIGHLMLPDRILLEEFDQWWRLLGVAEQVRALDDVVALVRARRPDLLTWLARRPLTAIELAPHWPGLLGALDWLLGHAGAAGRAGRRRHLREITAPGVDTKFVERHASVLAELLDTVDPELADRRHPGGGAFARRYGFDEPERLLRFRLDPALGALPGGIDEVGLPLARASALDLAPGQVLVVENQVTYLSVPLPPGGVVVWGHGFDALLLGRLPWLGGGRPVRYWGDLDTHGFAILDGLRAQVPQVTSVLMDRATLLAHQDRWVREGRPTRADLVRLNAAERALYEELVEDVHGPSVRLEQEREDWAWCLDALQSAAGPADRASGTCGGSGAR